MTSEHTSEFPIVQGPDRLAILTAFASYTPANGFSLSSDAPSNSVYFVVIDEEQKRGWQVRLHVLVQSVQHADESGTCWNIEGYLVKANPVPHLIRGNDMHSRARRVHILYRVNKKEGVLRIIEHGTIRAVP